MRDFPYEVTKIYADTKGRNRYYQLVRKESDRGCIFCIDSGKINLYGEYNPPDLFLVLPMDEGILIELSGGLIEMAYESRKKTEG